MTTKNAAQKSQYTTFIREMAAHGRQRRAYMAAYPGCNPQTADRGAHRLMEKQEIIAGIEFERERISIAEQRIREVQLTRQYYKLEDKEEVIWQILKGELQHTVYGKDGVILKRSEDPGLRLRAMKQDAALVKERAILTHEIAKLPGLAAKLVNLEAEDQSFDEALMQELDEQEDADEYTAHADNHDDHEDEENSPSGQQEIIDQSQSKETGGTPGALQLSPEQRREIDYIRQRIIAAQQATRTALYGETEIKK